MEKVNVGIIGGSGYTGVELLRILSTHPNFDVNYISANSYAGQSIAKTYPALASAYKESKFETFDLEQVNKNDLLFFCMPHGKSQDIINQCKDVKYIVDLSSDFRHKDKDIYDQYYGATHLYPEMLKDFVYGLPELYRDDIKDAKKVAAAGCYPTASILAIKPFIDTDFISKDRIIINAFSGLSGAGKEPTETNIFCNISDNTFAYKLSNHRHTPEIETHIDSQVLFTPHLIPTSRGILTTSYGSINKKVKQNDINEMLAEKYDNEKFVHVLDAPPQIKSVLCTNMVHIYAHLDERTEQIIMMSAIDNLYKGSSGQAVQCANLMLNIEEDTGLLVSGMYP